MNVDLVMNLVDLAGLVILSILAYGLYEEYNK